MISSVGEKKVLYIFWGIEKEQKEGKIIKFEDSFKNKALLVVCVKFLKWYKPFAVHSPRIILEPHTEESVVFFSQFFLATPVERTKAVSVCWTLSEGTGVGGPYTKMWVPVELFSSAPPASFAFSDLMGRLCCWPPVWGQYPFLLSISRPASLWGWERCWASEKRSCPAESGAALGLPDKILDVQLNLNSRWTRDTTCFFGLCGIGSKKKKNSRSVSILLLEAVWLHLAKPLLQPQNGGDGIEVLACQDQIYEKSLEYACKW